MIVHVGDRTYGWGSDVRELPTSEEAYGDKVLNELESKLLGQAINRAGWKPAWKRDVAERVVFLVKPGVWRQSVTMVGMRGQKLQVTQEPAIALPPPPDAEPAADVVEPEPLDEPTEEADPALEPVTEPEPA